MHDCYGDWGRELVLYHGRRRCELKLAELATLAGGIDYASAGMAIKRFEQRAGKDKALPHLVRTAEQQLREQC